MTLVKKYSVFTDKNGRYGDKATIVIDNGKKINNHERKALTKKLNSFEIAFVNDTSNADINIMHSQGEIDFAGVPMLGAAWYLTELNPDLKKLHSKGGDISISREGDTIWALANLNTMPAWNFKQLNDTQAVKSIDIKDTKEWPHTMVWAWLDKSKGTIVARTFAADWDIPEAQANGSGAIMLAAYLKRDIQIIHGNGSEIYAKPAPNRHAYIGGRVHE